MTKKLLQQALDALNGADQIDVDMQNAIIALEAAIAPPEKTAVPLGQIACYHDGRTEFYPWPESPYLDNALDCKTVYAIAQPEQPASYYCTLCETHVSGPCNDNLCPVEPAQPERKA